MGSSEGAGTFGVDAVAEALAVTAAIPSTIRWAMSAMMTGAAMVEDTSEEETSMVKVEVADGVGE